MINGLDISVAQLDAYLSENLDGFSGLRTAKKFAAGQSNPTYLLGASSGQYVLRAKPAGKLLKSAHMVEREYQVLTALAGSNVPVPKVYHLASEETSPIKRAFFIMEFLDGRIFWDPALPEVSVPERADIYDAMNAALAALHDIDPASVGLENYGAPGNYFARQLERWSGQYRASVDGERPEMERLIHWLEQNLPADDGQVALVHGDFRLDNMVFAPDRGEVIGVLDWELSTLGHPMADLAYQCMQWRLPYEAGMRGLGGLDRTELGLPSEAQYVAKYCARRGIEHPENWTFYLAFAFFRLAAILEGVVSRARRGNASNPEKARAFASAIPILVHLALDVTGEETGKETGAKLSENSKEN